MQERVNGADGHREQDAPEPQTLTEPAPEQRLGMVAGGSLTRGVDVRLDEDVSVETMSVGRFVTIQGERRRFFGVLTDVALEHTDRQVAATPPDLSDPFIAQVMSGVNAYGTIHVVPYLTLTGAVGAGDGPMPAKTVPPHFAQARFSDAKEIELIFGENDDQHILVGSPLDMEEAPVCLNAGRLVERSTGVFGKTGTGKSFLTRILLAQIAQKTEAVSLIFDMHGEYGWAGRTEGGREVKGLRQLLGNRVAVFRLHGADVKGQTSQADVTVQIGYDEITAEDIATLAGVMNLNDIQVQAVERLEKRGGKGWLAKFLAADSQDDLTDLAGGTEHEQTLAAVHRKLQRLNRMPFIVERPLERPVDRLMEHLDAGKHVVLEFGRFSRSLDAYVLVANLLTRRIHQRYVERMEQALSGQAKEPRNLIIAIEEAHKFLGPQVAHHTIFGAIAREMRKYNVTAAGHRPAPQRHRRRGALPDRHQDDLPPGRRPRHRRRTGGRVGQAGAASRPGQAGDEAAGPDLRPRRAHARRGPDPHLRRGVLPLRRLARRRHPRRGHQA